ncbi:hypothetical protein GGX14DRAFT_371006 [Mycena pura]|uniref:Uncharacterized protein n=1 Tax=Mycena pura TaxID=153505 RepID=A0AAD6YA02_9AGAR|nr:hypothetical protein GGX14DRAFT_371006 [Mycena pura]
MKFSAAVVALYFSEHRPARLSPDPLLTIPAVAAGVQAHQLPSRYTLARRGNQFVTGPCKHDSDCQQGCCAFNTGLCAGPGIAQTRDGGCGFGNAKPNCNVAKALNLGVCAHGAESCDVSDPAVQKAAEFTAKLDKLPPAKPATGKAAPSSAAPASSGKSVAQLAASQKSKKTVFETCSSDSQCQQGCCGFSTGKCAGPAVAQANGSGGCGRGASSPNCDVATLLGFASQCIKGAKNGNLKDATVQAAAAFAAQLDGISFTPS